MMKKSRVKEREITIKVIESKLCIHMLAEYFARKYKEKKIKDES